MTIDSECREVLVQQEQAVDAMSRLLNALLDVSKLESGKVEPSIVDFPIARVLEELRLEFTTVAEEKRIAFEIETCTALVRSDRALVTQVLANLIANAIKYTPAGWVKLRCSAAGTEVKVEIADSGIGIAGEHLSYIYDEFYQVGVAANSTRSGYGLGLSIVHRITQLLGIGIKLHSVLGKGTTFALQLPRGSTADTLTDDGAKTDGRHDLSSVSSSAKHVLLVEDDLAVRKATRMLLTVAGFKVTAAESLSEALASAKRESAIHLIVTDYHLSAGDTGLDVITAVRKLLGTKVPAILVTGDTSSAMQALPGDPDLRLSSKPVNADELLGLAQVLTAR